MNELTMKQALRAAQFDRDTRTERCLDESDIGAFVEHRLAPDHLHEVIGHLADCSLCRRDVVFLKRSESHPAGPVGVASDERFVSREAAAPARTWSRSRASYWRWGAVAAALLAGVVVWQGGRLRDPRAIEPAVDSVIRGSADGDAHLELLGLGDDAPLARQGLEFHWTELPDGAVYDVRIVSSDGRLVWETGTASRSVAVPADIVLEPGVTYYVRVQAQMAGGRVLRSPHTSFSIRDD